MHAADVTGREIERALLAAAASNPNIHFHEHHLAVDLVMGEVSGVPHCLGVDVLDQKCEQMVRFVAPVTMLATGGGGQVDFLHNVKDTLKATVTNSLYEIQTLCF